MMTRRTRLARILPASSRTTRRNLVLALAALVLVGGLLVSAPLVLSRGVVQAQGIEQSYDLSWFTVDGGGHTWSSGGTYTLGGTIGQPDAGLLAGGDGPPGRLYELGGGFWGGGMRVEVLHKVYLPLVQRSDVP